jgi:hypothetical protein
VAAARSAIKIFNFILFSGSFVMNNFLFLLGLSTLIAHELDAMAQSEWRLLYGLRHLPDSLAASAFVALHVPLMAGILWLTTHPSDAIRERSRLAMSIFLVVHAGLHQQLADHPAYTFTSPLSIGLIYGAGLLGLAYVMSVAIAFRFSTASRSIP